MSETRIDDVEDFLALMRSKGLNPIVRKARDPEELAACDPYRPKKTKKEKKVRQPKAKMVDQEFDPNTHTWTIPIETKPFANAANWKTMIGLKHGQKQKVFRAFGRYHGAVAWFADRGVWNNPPRTVGVIMTRLGGKEVDDDNLSGCFKWIRDAIADILGVDDKSPMVKWACLQRPGGGEVGVKIQFYFPESRQA